jgi:integrase
MSRSKKILDTFSRLEKDSIYMKWYNEAFDRQNTRLSYRYGLRCFCDFLNMQPSELIKEAQDDYLNRVAPWQLSHIKHIEDFIIFLKTKNDHLTNNSKLNHIKAIKNFYQFNKIPVILTKIGITQGASERYLDIPRLKLEDIRKAVLSTGLDKFLKAFILTSLSSGQGQYEIRALKGKHLKNINNGVAIVNMTRGKTNRRYFFFIGKEALDAIHEYKPNLKDDDFIFTQKLTTTDGDIRNTPLSAQEVTCYFSRHAEKLGLDRSYFAPHRFRHYFKTALTGNMDNIYVEYLLGHKLPGVESNYFLGDQEKMIEQYLKNQKYLTVFTEQEQLQKEYDELKSKSGDLISIKEENQKLKVEMEELKQDQIKFYKDIEKIMKQKYSDEYISKQVERDANGNSV